MSRLSNTNIIAARFWSFATRSEVYRLTQVITLSANIRHDIQNDNDDLVVTQVLKIGHGECLRVDAKQSAVNLYREVSHDDQHQGREQQYGDIDDGAPAQKGSSVIQSSLCLFLASE